MDASDTDGEEITIHFSPSIEWQDKRWRAMKKGLVTLGYKVTATNSPTRLSAAPAILFGTTLWGEIERDTRGDWLLVDRASYGDPDYVQLGWNGRGRNGEFCVPPVSWPPYSQRFKSHTHLLPPVAPEKIRNKAILCGDANAPESWYREVAPSCDAFKPHPAIGHNPTNLPTVDSFDEASFVYVYNSSVAVQLALSGIPVRVYDKACMGYNLDVRWLAWTLWSWDEIERGVPIAHIIEYGFRAKGIQGTEQEAV
jgi:hypothetical protein